MDELEVYSDGWKMFMPQYLEYGLKPNEVQFSMEWEGAPAKFPILLYLSKRVYQILKRTAKKKQDGFDKLIQGIETEAPPRSGLVILSIPDRSQLFMIQAIIAMSFPLLKEEKRRRVEANNKEIDELALCMIEGEKKIKKGKAFYRSGWYYLPYYYLAGKEKRARGKNVKEVIKDFQGVLDQISS